jgi:ribose transport system substrate-binding protein
MTMSLNWRGARRTAVLISLVAVVGACSSTGSSSTPTAPGESAAATTSGESAAPPSAAAKTEYNVAMIRWAASDVFFNGVQLGQQIEKDRILKEDGVTINWKLFGANDASKQIDALNAFLAAGVDAVDIVPWKGEAFTEIVTKLHDQGVPVVVHNANVPNAPQVFVAFDNVSAGKTAGEAAVKALDAARGQSWRQSEGVFIELRCIITASFDIGRDKGYHEVVDPIAAASGGKIKMESREVTCNDSKGRQAADDIISKYGQDKILGVLAVDGDSGFGAASALQARGMAPKAPTDPAYIPVVAVDGSEAEFIAMSKGDMLTAAEQPAVAEGVIVERLLYQMMKTGQLIEAPTSDSTFDMPDYAGAPWLPVKITTSPDFTGAWYQTQAFDSAALPLDDHWHWANILDQSKTGVWPSYGPNGCTGCPGS